ncbi:hypothetical protein T484DRAFT_1800940 [Baffinella frigidus]|nr:hypothetical protein T484DRAFT_1800940 [Cryptophyta sp. CCMP2293]
MDGNGRADMDGNGRVDFEEFGSICEMLGLTNEVLGGGGVKTLFHFADKDDSGVIDFQEFLAAVVGNLTSDI